MVNKIVAWLFAVSYNIALMTTPTRPALGAARRPRPVISPNFGRQLTRLRGTRSRGDVVRGLQRYGIAVDRSTLLQYEHGSVSAPDPAILWALGRYYGLDSIDELIAVLVMDRTGRALREGIDIAISPFSNEQREIAEAYGGFPVEVKTALRTVFTGLQAGNLTAAALGGGHRHKVRA